MLNRIEQHHHSPKETPPVGRPRGAAWRSLQADGVVWEGQVVLVGGDVDLAARMIVTHRRVAFIRGGEVVLEIPRGWLRQEPVLRRDGTLELFVATPESNPFDEPMRVPLRMREGHPAAGHIIAMLAPGGVRRIAPDAMSAIERAREASPTPSFGGFWDGIESTAPASRDAMSTIIGRAGDDDPDLQLPAAPLTPLEPPDRLLRVSSTPPQGRPVVNGFSIAGLPPRDQRRSSWGLLLRLAALTILLATAAALGAGRLNIQVPGTNFGAILAAPTATAPASATNNDLAPTAASGAALSSQDLTAVAVGVGGDDEDALAVNDEPAAAPETSASGGPAMAQAPAAAPTKPAIPTPAATNPPALAQTPTTEATAAQASADAPASTTPSVAQAPAATADASASSILVGSLHMTISNALRGETLPKYGLPPGTGEWILLMADIKNEGSSSAALAMNDIRLLDRGAGTVATLDTGTDVIASLAGYEPARGANDTITLASGDSTETLLLYLLPAGSGDQLSLQVGQSSLDLAPAFAAGSPTPGSDQQLVDSSLSVGTTELAFLHGGWRERLAALQR